MPSLSKSPPNSKGLPAEWKTSNCFLPLDVLKGISDAVVQVDGKHLVTYANPPATALLGKAEQELTDRPLPVLFSPSSRESVRLILNASDSTDVPMSLPVRLNDGRSLHMGVLARVPEEDPANGGIILKLWVDSQSAETLDRDTLKDRDLSLIGDVSGFRVTGMPVEDQDGAVTSALPDFQDVNTVHRLRDYLNASASVASLLLKGINARELMGEILEIMGRVSNASRCYWFENSNPLHSGIRMNLHAEWCAPDIISLQGNEVFQDSEYEEGVSLWRKKLHRGRLISGRVADFHPEERRLLSALNVRAVLMIPLSSQDKPLGFIGFDNCTSDRAWKEEEVNLLRTTAGLLSKAFEHDQSLSDLRESEARYKDIYDNIYDAWYLLDMDGRFLEVNPAVERTTGYSQDELLTMNVRDLIPRQYLQQFDRYRREIREKGVSEGLIQIRAKNGEERVLEYRNWLTIDAEGSPASRGLVRDITERANLRRQLKHAQRMESIGTLASGISHSFRNILTGITTNIQLIQMKYGHKADLNQYAAQIFKLTQAGSDLIKNLLVFSHKGLSESKAVINLSDVLTESLNIVSRSFDKSISINTCWPEMLPIFAERTSISQVIMNICMNAQDAMPSGGTLGVFADHDGDHVTIRIQDTGTGMDEVTLAKVYDPFFTTKAPGKGTGLGLYMAYGIVKNNGGEMVIESEPGLGTTFEITFPVPEAFTETASPPAPELVRGKNQRVLIADDDETILKPMIELLEGLGYKAAATSNGYQAVEIYFSRRYDVILLDRDMPDMEGLEAARRIFERDPGARIIMISGYDEEGPDSIDDPVRDLIGGYITKPFDILDLSKILAEVLSK